MASAQDKLPKKPTTPTKAAAKATASTTRKAAAKDSAKPRTARRRSPTHDAIAERAYEISQAHGGGSGGDVAHWLRAERELSES